MKKLLKTLACSAVAALVGASAFANYDWYDTSIGIGGIKSNFQEWSRGNGAPDTDLGALTSLTLSSVEMNIWDDDNDREGVNMFFRLYGADGQIGGDVDVWLGGAERIEGSVHDFSVSYTGPFNLADAFGVTLEDGKTYYLNMWAKSYGNADDHWYNGNGDNYHTKFVYCATPKTYTLVESADDLVVGADYLVVSTVDGAYSAMKNEVNGTGIGCLGLADDAISGNTISAASDAIVWQLLEGTAVGQCELYNAAANVFAADSDDLAGRAQLLADGTDALAQWTIDTSALPAVKFYSVSYEDRYLQRDNFAANERFAAYEQAHVAPCLYRDDSMVVQTVTFDPSPYGTFRGEPTMTMTFEFGGTYHDLPGTTPDGTHARIGWFTTPDGDDSGEPVADGDDVTLELTRTLYAHWTDKQTLTFDPQNGEEPWTEVFTVGSTYGTLPKPTWAGHAFVGWFTEAGKKLSNTSKVTTRPERTIYAQWTTEQTVVFDAQGGDCDPATMTAEMGGRYGPLPKPTKAGYAFVGWYTKAEGGSHLTANSIVTTLKTRTFYAHWTDRQQVTFVADPGTSDAPTGDFAVGLPYEVLPRAELYGYIFKGWYTKAEGGSKVTSAATVTSAKTRTLYAHWKEKGAAPAITGFSMSFRSARGATRSGTATLPIAHNYTGTQSWTELTGFSGSGVGTYADGRCKFDSDNDWLMVQFDGVPGTLTFAVKGNSASSGTSPGSFLVQESADGSQWTTVVDLASSEFSSTAYANFGPYALASSSRYVRWTYAQKYNFNLGLNNVSITAGSSSEPTVTLTLDPDVTKVAVNDMVEITAAASGFSGDVTWSWTGSGLDDGNTFVFGASVADEYTVTATATAGSQTASESVTFTVCEPHAIIVTAGEHGDAEASAATAIEGTMVTVDWLADDGYTLDTIKVNGAPIDGTSFEMPDAIANVNVTFKEKPAGFEKITSLDQLTDGEYVITGVKDADEFAMKAAVSTTSTKYILRRTTAVTIEDGAVTDADDDIIWTLAKNDDDQWTIYNSATGYVYLASSANSANIESEPDANNKCLWTISLNSDGDGTFSVVNVAYDARHLRFNNANNQERFACYQRSNSGLTGSGLNFYKAPSAAGTQTVTFDPSPYGTFRGEATMEMTFDFGGTYHDLPNTTPDGTHARIGWYRVPDGEAGDPVLEGDEVSGDATVTFYAHWTDKQTLTFDPQNGEEPWTEVFTVGSTYGTLPKPTWAGHAFVGWFTEAGKKLSNTSKVTTRPERTIYAQWSTEQTVIFDAQGGDCDPATMTAEMGGRYGPLPKPTKAGYAFVGWYTKAEGGSHLTANSIVTTLKTRTFYAHWTAEQTVTFVANGGSCDTATMVATIGETYGEMPKATQDGYIFRGWYTKAEGGSKVTAAATVTAAKTRTLYAHWKEKGAAPAITAFSVSPRAATSATRAAGAGILECTLVVETSADFVYEVQWTTSLLGEWTVLKHWTAAEDGEFPVTVEVPADTSAGFLRIVEFDEE